MKSESSPADRVSANFYHRAPMVSMANIVVGVFDEYANAEAAREELLSLGLTATQVRIAERSQQKRSQRPAESEAGADAAAGTEADDDDHDRFWNNIRDYFGIDEDDDGQQRQPIAGAVLTIIADRTNRQTITNILLKYEPATINGHSHEPSSDEPR